MTIKHQYLAEPSDVLAIILTCQQCHVSLSMPIGQRECLPDDCPSCHKGWFLRGSNDRKILTDLLQGLAELQGRGKDAPCQIYLEILPPNGQP